MSKKQVMKEIFEEKINKERIYHNVLLKVEEKCNINKEKNKKLLYCITSSIAVFILGFGIILGTKILNNNLDNKVQKYSDIKVESIELHINKGERTINDSLSNFDIRVEEANYFMIPYFECLKDLKIPDDFNKTSYYKISGRENQNWNEEIKESDYNILLCWQINYYNNDKSNTRSIGIFLSDKGIPGTHNCIPPKVKDCIPSKINGVELMIYEYSGENSYLVEFSYKGYGFSIETNGITEDELVELLQSIIMENSIINKPVDDKDVNENEQTSENINTNYPDYYAGKYVDNNGNNVVLLCEDSKSNRKEICNLLGITESKTIFKTAKYSYNYLIDLQSKISQKMINKEFTFVITSSLMEDSNNIKVSITSNNEDNLNKVKALDLIGGAIEFEYNTNVVEKEDLLVEKE